MKISLATIGLLSFFSITIIPFSDAASETLKQYSTVCRTKDDFKELVDNRDDKGHVMRMLADGKCVMNVTGAIQVKVLEGVFPMVKVELNWGDDKFIGWTETVNVANR